MYARRAGSDFDAATALVFMSWCLVEGPWPRQEAIARCEALMRRCRARGPAQPARLPRGPARDGRPLRGGARGHGPRAGRLRRPAARPDGRYLALLVALAETLAGDPVAAERAVRDAEAMVSGPGDRWYQAMVNVDLALTVIAQDRPADAAAVVEQIDAVPAPCDLEWAIKRHVARALVAGPVAGLEEAETAAWRWPRRPRCCSSGPTRSAPSRGAARGRPRRGGRGGPPRARAGRAQGQHRERAEHADALRGAAGLSGPLRCAGSRAPKAPGPERRLGRAVREPARRWLVPGGVRHVG